MGRITGYFQTARYDQKVQVGYDGKHDTGQRNGDGQNDEPFQDVTDTFLRKDRPVCRQMAFQFMIVIDEDQPCRYPAGTGTETGTASGIIKPVRKQQCGKSEHDHDADELFDNL